MPVAVRLGVVGHIAVRLCMAGMDRLLMTYRAASAVQTVHSCGDMTIVAAQDVVVWPGEEIEPVIELCAAP